jgi:hypothetical protein
MPFNFFYVSLIKKTIPHSKIIFCSRDYCDIGLSIYKNDFALNLDFAYDQKNIIDYVTAFDSIMKQWKNRLALEIYEIKYEDLIRDPETHVSSLLDFCNLEFDQDCLHFYKKQLTSDTVSTNQVTNNFYDSSIGVWKNYYPYYKSFFDSSVISVSSAKYVFNTILPKSSNLTCAFVLNTNKSIVNNSNLYFILFLFFPQN